MSKAMHTPSQHFLEIVHFPRVCLRLVGLDLLDPNYRKNFLTGCLLFWIFAYPLFMLSTILQEFEENWMIILEAFCVAITVFQGSTKFFCALSKRKVILATFNMLLGIYQKYELQGELYSKALTENCVRVQKAMKVMLLTCLLPWLSIIALPFMMMLIDSGNRYLMIPLLIPYIDVNTTSGYLATLAVQCTVTFLGSFGIFSADLGVLIYFSQSFVFSDILRLKIMQLNDMLNNADNRYKPQVQAALVDIIKWQQMYSSFTDMCNECFYWFIVVCVTTSGAGIVLTLFMLITTDWPGAYPYLVLGFYTLYMYCILGTKIEICNDQFIEDIYEINWYNMTSAQQKTVLFILMRSQSPKNIKIAGVLPLSVATALRITKTVYTIFMMMLQFLSE